jgi:hypothetical protein
MYIIGEFMFSARYLFQMVTYTFHFLFCFILFVYSAFCFLFSSINTPAACVVLYDNCSPVWTLVINMTLLLFVLALYRIIFTFSPSPPFHLFTADIHIHSKASSCRNDLLFYFSFFHRCRSRWCSPCLSSIQERVHLLQ